MPAKTRQPSGRIPLVSYSGLNSSCEEGLYFQLMAGLCLRRALPCWRLNMPEVALVRNPSRQSQFAQPARKLESATATPTGRSTTVISGLLGRASRPTL